MSALIVPGGCAVCGLPQYGHLARQSSSGDLHLFTAPTAEQIAVRQQTSDSTKAPAVVPAGANDNASTL